MVLTREAEGEAELCWCEVKNTSEWGERYKANIYVFDVLRYEVKYPVVPVKALRSKRPRLYRLRNELDSMVLDDKKIRIILSVI